MEKDKQKWFIGFDTNHFDDTNEEKNFEYVKFECEKFIEKWRHVLTGIWFF